MAREGGREGGELAEAVKEDFCYTDTCQYENYMTMF